MPDRPSRIGKNLPCGYAPVRTPPACLDWSRSVLACRGDHVLVQWLCPSDARQVFDLPVANLFLFLVFDLHGQRPV
jgi:hypothetical protein